MEELALRYQQLLQMIDARNATSHVYDEKTADIISRNIVNYYNILKTIIKKINHD